MNFINKGLIPANYDETSKSIDSIRKVYYISPFTITTARFTPHKQIQRAGYIFFIHMMDKFKRKFPVYQIVATYRQLPQIPYEYVTQLTIRELVDYILRRQERLNHSDVLSIISWLRFSPQIFNSKLKLRLF